MIEGTQTHDGFELRTRPTAEADEPRDGTLRVGLLIDAGALFVPMVLANLTEGQHVSVSTVFCRTSERSILKDARRFLTVAQQSGVRYAAARAIATARTSVPELEDALRPLDCEVLVIESARTSSFASLVKERELDLLVTILYPEILPVSVIESARLGGLNLHPSLLPDYAGTNPLFWALANGEERVGVTIHHLEKKVDTGPIVAQASLEVGRSDTLTSLYSRCAAAGGRLLTATLETIAREGLPEGRAHSVPRYFSRPTPASYRRLRALGRRL